MFNDNLTNTLNQDSTEKAAIEEIFNQNFSKETDNDFVNLNYLQPNKDIIPTITDENQKCPWGDENSSLLMDNQTFNDEIQQLLDSDQIEVSGIY